jgi:hypothetical protein
MEFSVMKAPETFKSPPKSVVPCVEVPMLFTAPETNRKTSLPIEPVANTAVLMEPLWLRAEANG